MLLTLQLSDYELSLGFVRAASVNMRPLGMSNEPAAARRLLEVDDSHTLEMALPLIERKVTSHNSLCNYWLTR